MLRKLKLTSHHQCWSVRGRNCPKWTTERQKKLLTSNLEEVTSTSPSYTKNAQKHLLALGGKRRDDLLICAIHAPLKCDMHWHSLLLFAIAGMNFHVHGSGSM